MGGIVPRIADELGTFSKGQDGKPLYHVHMEPRSILRTYATAMVVCLALAIGTQILLGSSVEFMTMTLVCGIVEASTALLALGGAVWFTQAAWGRGYRRAVVTAWVAAVCLVVGWGSMAVARSTVGVPMRWAQGRLSARASTRLWAGVRLSVGVQTSSSLVLERAACSVK